ncbi:MAG: arsenic resistance protein [Gammaproteobacteria bacterium]|nr:MAG: arsenic resistance protein [Gammaproteobacteria bacterium]
MWRILQLIQSKLIIAIPVLMVSGIVLGYFTDVSFLKAAILPLTFLMVYPMMVNLQVEKLIQGGGLKVQLTAQAINFLIIPFIAFFIGSSFFSESPAIVLGLLLAALLPTSGMTISWTGFAKGNMAAAIKMTVIGLILGSALTPLYIKMLAGTSIEIPLFKIFTQIILIVFLPMVAGMATRKFIVKKIGIEKYNANLKSKFPLLSTVGVLGIVFVAMALKAKDITSDPNLILKIIVPLAGIYVVNYILSTLVGKLFFNREDAIALVYGTVMRNLSIALAIAMTAFSEQGAEIAIVVALAYIIQVQSASWYVKFTDKIFI